MSHIGAICDPSPSHVMNMISIGHALVRRGYHFTVFQNPETARVAATDGVVFSPLVRAGIEPKSSSGDLKRLSQHKGLFIRGTNERMVRSARLICETAPAALRDAGVDLLLVDQLEPAASTVAEHLHIPFVTVCNALPLNSEPGIPPAFLAWDYNPKYWAACRNRFAYAVRNVLIQPVHSAINHYRREWGLRAYRTPDDSFSPFAQISQLVRELDFPRRQLPSCFHYVGPYQRQETNEPSFPWDRLDGHSFVYVCLGTILGGRKEVLEPILEACADLKLQTVLSLGGEGDVEDYDGVPGYPIVVKYAPQRQLLSRASLAITHAGINSVMEALSCGVPMISIPFVSDQPGIAARIAYWGAGETVRLHQCRTKPLQMAIRRVFENRKYRERAVSLQQIVLRYRGSEAAADIIENVILKRTKA